MAGAAGVDAGVVTFLIGEPHPMTDEASSIVPIERAAAWVMKLSWVVLDIGCSSRARSLYEIGREGDLGCPGARADTTAQYRDMKAFVGLALGAALLLSAAASVVSLHPSPVGARSCYSVWAQADRMGSRYRHIVYVENDCEYWLQCSLWTDVDPQPPQMLTVGPGMVEHAETNGASQYDDPRAFGACHRK
jgi:hypothetical protein